MKDMHLVLFVSAMVCISIGSSCRQSEVETKSERKRDTAAYNGYVLINFVANEDTEARFNGCLGLEISVTSQSGANFKRAFEFTKSDPHAISTHIAKALKENGIDAWTPPNADSITICMANIKTMKGKMIGECAGLKLYAAAPGVDCKDFFPGDPRVSVITEK
jgi:hypothetical protein